MTESAGGLVSTIRVLAETLGLEAIIAEGVETPEQRDALVDLGWQSSPCSSRVSRRVDSVAWRFWRCR
jgi:hypothetical protein